MPFDAIIFDLDGTLWDSTAVCADSWNSALDKLKIPPRNFSAQDIAGIMGQPHQEIRKKIFPTLTEEEQKKVARACYLEEIDFIRAQGSPLYPGVEEGLQRLQKKFPLFLLSNCLVEYLDTFLNFTQFSKYFKDSLCHGHTGMPKAHNMRVLSEKHGLKNPVYIGDTSGDHRSAKDAGIAYFHVTYGFGKPFEKCPEFSSFLGLVEHLETGGKG